jgi:quinoprotein glucose dehydrogenase
LHRWICCRGKATVSPCLLLTIFFSACHTSTNPPYHDWKVTGGTKENIRYSALTDIDTSNVAKLQVAWTYYSEKQDSTHYGPIECNPIVIDSTLYGVSPRLKLFAVDAAIGKEKWSFDPADSVLNKTWHRKSVNMPHRIFHQCNNR